MKDINGYIQHVEDWYSFYKEVKRTSRKPTWLIDLALEWYEEKLSDLYIQRDRMEAQFDETKTLKQSEIPPTYFGPSHHPTQAVL